MLRVEMLLDVTPAPNLPLVIGLPVGLMVVASAIAIGAFIVLARLQRG